MTYLVCLCMPYLDECAFYHFWLFCDGHFWLSLKDVIAGILILCMPYLDEYAFYDFWLFCDIHISVLFWLICVTLHTRMQGCMHINVNKLEK